MGELADAVRAKRATELERLGSDRGLIALTDADLSGEAIRDRFAGVLLAVAGVYNRWADDSDGRFEEAETTTREVAETVAATTAVDPADEHPVIVHLDTLEGNTERVGAGLVAAPMIFDGWALQGVSFFVNEADERNADRFREARSALDDLVAAGERALGDEQQEPATVAATDLISVAYDDYVETLDGLGLDPKTVC